MGMKVEDIDNMTPEEMKVIIGSLMRTSKKIDSIVRHVKVGGFTPERGIEKIKDCQKKSILELSLVELRSTEQ